MTDRAARRAARTRARLKGRSQWAPSAEAAEKEIRRTKRRRYQRHRSRVRAAILLLALLAGYFIATQALLLVVVRGTGMSPTLEGGSVVVCVRQSLLDALAGILPEELRRVKQNDVVVLDYQPVDEDGEPLPGAKLVKRVIALEGSTVDMVDGIMVVDGDPLFPLYDAGDRVYPITVPGRQMFVMGDHREVAVDSRRRAFGTVPESQVIARPLAAIWPAYAVGLVR